MKGSPMDSELRNGADSPYLARQAAMREFMERALCGNPDERDVNGLYFLSAPTGSGKNYTAEQLAADLVMGGWDRYGRLKMCKGRRNLVFVVPLKANRDEFVSNVRALLVEREIKEGEANRIVFGLPGNADGILNWLNERYGRDFDSQGSVPCPFEMDDQADERQVRAAWEDAIDLAMELRETERRAAKPAFKRGKRLIGLREQLGRAEHKLRREISRNAKGIKAGSEIIPEIWPSARLCDRTMPHVIACTPQKLLTRIDTVIGPNAVFFDKEAASESVFIFDEVDHAKSDMTSFLLGQSVCFQPDELLRTLDSRFNGGSIDPLLLGDRHQWLALYGTAETDPDYAGSRAATGKVRKRDVLAAAEAIERSADQLKKAISSCISELDLARPFALSDEMGKEALAGRRLFGRDDISVSLRKGSVRPLVYVPNADRTRNLLTSADDKQGQYLERALRRARGVVRMAVGHLARCAYVMDGFYREGVCYREGVSRRNVIDALGVRNDATDEKFFWDGLMLALFFQDRKNDEVDASDDSIYARGVGYIAMETTEEHLFTTYLRQQSVERLAESYLASIASCAPCVCMSATWNAPTIKNFNLEYLDEVHGIVRKDDWIDRLNGEILRQTRAFNEYAAQSYKLDFDWVESSAAFMGLAAFADGCTVAPDMAIDRAREFLAALGVSEDTIGQIISKTTQTLTYSLHGAAEFNLGRLGKMLTAVGTWARGVACGKHYAGAIFTTRDMGKYDEFNSLALELSRLVVADLVVRSDDPNADSTKVLQDASEAVLCLNAGGWDAGWHAAEGRLKRGKSTFLFINLAAGGFSKNLKFKVPLRLADSVRRLDCGYGEADDAAKMDLDFIYVESPSFRMTWNVDTDDKTYAERVLMGVVEQEELAACGEISYAEKRNRVRRLFALGARGGLSVRETRSFRCEGARIVGQAIGRVMRTNVKMPQVTVMLDRKIAEDCDFSFLKGQPLGYELERVVDAWMDVGAHREGGAAAEMTRRQNLAAYRNRQTRERHELLAWKVLSSHANEEDLARFDAERDFYLTHFCMPWDDLAGYPAWRNSMLKMPYAVEGYAYADAKGKTAPEFEFPLRDGEPVAEAADRLAQRCPGAKIRIVSQEAARVSELIAIPEVERRWRSDGVSVRLCRPATAHMTPYMFQAVYLGALGEAAGRAIFEAYFDGVYRLTRGAAGNAERCGDYLVLDSNGGDTGVWIDFKHYRIGAYEQYAAGGREKNDAERYEEKLAAVGAKRVLIVNVLADDAARGLRSKSVNGSGTVRSVPFMAADGAIDIEMMEAIRRAIEY